MNNNMIKEAKKTYLQSGRLNQNIVRKEISISWYKCKLQSLDVNATIKSTHQTIEQKFDHRFIRFINSVVPSGFMFVLANQLLQVVDYNLDKLGVEHIDSIDDLIIGTNAGYLAMKTGTDMYVNLEEHYLNIFCSFYSVGIIIKKNDHIDGVLMLFSELPINEYVIHSLKSEITSYYSKEGFTVLIEENNGTRNEESAVSNSIIYPIEKYNSLLINSERIFKKSKLLIIKGDVKSGRTAFAYDLCLKHKRTPAIVDLASINNDLHAFIVQTGLSQFDTVILKNFQMASAELTKLLMVYSDENIQGEIDIKSNNMKCSRLILITVNSEDSNITSAHKKLEGSKQVKLFEDKYQLFTVNLLKPSELEQEHEIEEIIYQTEKKYSASFSSKFRDHLKIKFPSMTFREFFEYIENAIEYNKKLGTNEVKYLPLDTTQSLLSLHENEKNYVLEVYNALNQNISAAADVLQIGRATLYRKLNLYQIDTKNSKRDD